jgi:hypothetical protein
MEGRRDVAKQECKIAASTSPTTANCQPAVAFFDVDVSEIDRSLLPTACSFFRLLIGLQADRIYRKEYGRVETEFAPVDTNIRCCENNHTCLSPP